MYQITHRAKAGFAAALLVIASFALATPAAQADPSVDQAALLACTDGGGVFVVVTNASGVSTGTCVTAPTSGTDALDAAGVAITRDATGMICALNNYPNPCPATFDGKYWQYYQASGQNALDGQWDYATAGSDDTTPQPGWVEGWCYGDQCVPAWPGADIAPNENTPSDAHVGSISSQTVLIVGIFAAVVVVAVVVIMVAKRRPAGSREA